MFKELNDNLTSIEGEVTKLKTAVEHIDTAKAAAQTVVNAATTINAEFKQHLLKVTKEVDSILKPHLDLIAETQKLTKTISEIDFPTRLDKQEKELKFLKIVAIAAISVSLIETVLIIVMRSH